MLFSSSEKEKLFPVPPPPLPLSGSTSTSTSTSISIFSSSSPSHNSSSSFPYNADEGHSPAEEEASEAEVLAFLSLFFSLLMAFLCLFGAISNSMSLVIFAKASFRRRSINVLLCGLSLSDLFLCTLALPVFSLAQIQQFIPGMAPELSNRLLVFCYPLCLMAQTMSVWMLVVITIDRWLAVCHPFSMRIHCTVKRARLSVLAIFLFSLGYNLVRFWEYRIDPDGQVVGLLRGNYLFMLLYQNLATTLSQFLLPLCVLCPLNLQVARAILAARERRKTLWAELSAVEASREQSTAVMVVVLVFLLCYSCSNVLNVLEMFLPDFFRTPAGFLLNDVNNVLVVFNSASSSLFYARFSSRYRSQLICLLRHSKLFDSFFPKQSSPPNESPSRALSVGILLSRPKFSTTVLSIGPDGRVSTKSSTNGNGNRLRAHSACPFPL